MDIEEGWGIKRVNPEGHDWIVAPQPLRVPPQWSCGLRDSWIHFRQWLLNLTWCWSHADTERGEPVPAWRRGAGSTSPTQKGGCLWSSSDELQTANVLLQATSFSWLLWSQMWTSICDKFLFSPLGLSALRNSNHLSEDAKPTVCFDLEECVAAGGEGKITLSGQTSPTLYFHFASVLFLFCSLISNFSMLFCLDVSFSATVRPLFTTCTMTDCCSVRQ